MQVNVAVVLDLITRAGFQIRQLIRIRQRQPKMRAHIISLGFAGAEQVDPDRADALEIFPALNGNLLQPAVQQDKCVHLAFVENRLPATSEHVPQLIRHFPQDIVLLTLSQQGPQSPAILDGQGLKQ